MNILIELFKVNFCNLLKAFMWVFSFTLIGSCCIDQHWGRGLNPPEVAINLKMLLLLLFVLIIIEKPGSQRRCFEINSVVYGYVRYMCIVGASYH